MGAEYDQKKQLHPSQTRLNKSLSQTTEQNGTHPKAQTTTQPITEMNKHRSQLNPALQSATSTTTANLSCLLCKKRGMTTYALQSHLTKIHFQKQIFENMEKIKMTIQKP